MNIVIVEDEIMIARRIILFCQNILLDTPHQLHHFVTFDEAQQYLQENPIDVLLLDLNLNNQDGFSLLKNQLAIGYQTIIISANSERAIEAFEYGVSDFVAKPFNQQRLEKAFERVKFRTKNSTSRPLAIKKYGQIELIDISQIAYVQAARQYSEVFLLDGSSVLHHKNLAQLLQILPSEFERVHKSYALAISKIKVLHKKIGSRYHLELHNNVQIPLGRTHYARVKGLLNRE